MQTRRVCGGSSEEKPAILCLIEALQRAGGESLIAARFTRDPALVVEHIRGLVIRGGLHQGSVYVLALAGNETVVDGQGSGERGQDPGADVDEVVRSQNRWNRAGTLHDASHRLALPFPAAARRPRPAITIAAHGRVDDVRLASLRLLIANAESIGSARGEILQDDIRLLHKLPEDLLTFERCHVEQQ